VESKDSGLVIFQERKGSYFAFVLGFVVVARLAGFPAVCFPVELVLAMREE
jgi:hypothetical protein